MVGKCEITANRKKGKLAKRESGKEANGNSDKECEGCGAEQSDWWRMNEEGLMPEFAVGGKVAKWLRGKAAVWNKGKKGKGASWQNGIRCGDTCSLEDFLTAQVTRAATAS